jgi:hypothetical protein
LDAAGPAVPAEVRRAITASWGGRPTADSPRISIPIDSIKAEVERLGENDDERNLRRQ